MVILAMKWGGVELALWNFFESWNLFSIESNGLESLDVNAVDQYTFSQLKRQVSRLKY